MKNLAMIACVSADGGLGKGNELLWRFPEDQKFFRTTTMGAAVVMGSKTFQSIGRALPGRENLVLSHGEIADDGIKVFHDRAELDRYLESLPGQKFIIGGASLYAAYLPMAETIYLTEVDAQKPADVFFPAFNRDEYHAEVLQSGATAGIPYRMIKYTKKGS